MFSFDSIKSQKFVKKFRKDTYIFRNGQPSRAMYIILSGQVAVFPNDSLEEDLSRRLSAGEVLGEVDFLEGLSHSFSARALEETAALCISRENEEEFYVQNPALLHKVMKSLTSRLVQNGLRLPQKKDKEVQETPSETVHTDAKASNNNLKSIQQLDGPLFPPHHQNYLLSAPESHKPYIYQRKLKCPVCKQRFHDWTYRMHRVILQSTDHDFRHRYQDMEPLWYLVWVCPNCLYAAPNYDFDSVTEAQRETIPQHNAKLLEEITLDDDWPVQIQTVFLRYYLALHSLQPRKHTAMQEGNLWLRLSWLYSDLNDSTMFEYATNKAEGFFSQIFYDSSRYATVEQDQRLAIVLAELYIRQEKPETALETLFSILRKKHGKDSLARKARDRALDIRKSMETP